MLKKEIFYGFNKHFFKKQAAQKPHRYCWPKLNKDNFSIKVQLQSISNNILGKNKKRKYKKIFFKKHVSSVNQKAICVYFFAMHFAMNTQSLVYRVDAQIKDVFLG